MTSRLTVIHADWPAPNHVHACTTTRTGGVSAGSFASLNLADHVVDDPAAVERNRQLLSDALGLPAPPRWLHQVHGTDVVDTDKGISPSAADGSVTRSTGTVLAILTADCFPILLCDSTGTQIAALHAGWRGLLNGIVARGVTALAGPPDELLAWIGPGISARHYRVGAEVRDGFVSAEADNAACFAETEDHRGWHCDLRGLCSAALLRAGVTRIHHDRRCTFDNPDTLYSYRREPTTGRMATLIWLD